MRMAPGAAGAADCWADLESIGLTICHWSQGLNFSVKKCLDGGWAPAAWAWDPASLTWRSPSMHAGWCSYSTFEVADLHCSNTGHSGRGLNTLWQPVNLNRSPTHGGCHPGDSEARSTLPVLSLWFWCPACAFSFGIGSCNVPFPHRSYLFCSAVLLSKKCSQLTRE